MRSRAFLNVSFAILALAAAYHLGARSATAQAGGQIVGFSGSGGHCDGLFYAITSSGDVYSHHMVAGPCGGSSGPLEYLGNFWGGPTPTQQDSWGGVKARYR